MPMYFVDDGRGTFSSSASLPNWTPWNDMHTLRSDDVLVIHADNSLQALEAILREPRHKAAGIAVVSFQPLADLRSRREVLQPDGFVFKQWPIGTNELADLAAQAQKLPAKAKQRWWANARALLARKDANQAAQAARHKFAGRRAAVRLLQGAFLSREISAADYETALMELSSAEGVTLDVKAHLQELARFHGSLPANGTTKLREILRGNGKLLVVDDQVHTAGWTVFFDKLLPGQAEYAETAKEALKKVQSGSDDLALVLLDLQLPDTPEQGLQVLRQIKQQQLDLPVVIFSAVDEIPMARRCLRAGADDYFVKELGQDDRDPLDYYDKFKELLKRNLLLPESRQLWRDLRDMPAPEEHAAGHRLFEEVKTYLHLAWYFLTTDTSDPRFSALFDKKQRQKADVYSHCVVEMGRALEALIDHHYDRARLNERAERIRKFLGRAPKPSFAAKVKRLQQDRILKGSQADDVLAVWGLRSRKAAHPGNKVQMRDALYAFARTIKLVRALLPAEIELEGKLNLSISDLELSVRATNCLESEGITSVRELVNRTEKELLEIRNFSETTLREVKRKLDELGLALKGS